MRITQRELFVYAADLTCVARHELAPRGAGHKLDPAGLHPLPRGKPPVDLDQLAAVIVRRAERPYPTRLDQSIERREVLRLLTSM